MGDTVSSQLRVAVVGGGVVGLCVAYFLCRRGAQVTLIERDRVGAGASSGNAGWICPSLIAPLPAPGVRKYALRSMWRPSSPLFIAPRLDPALAKWLRTFWRNCTPEAYRAGLAAMAPLGRRTATLYDQFESDGPRFEMVRQGLLFACLDTATAQRDLASLKALTQHGYAIPEEPMTRGELEHLEPALSEQVRSGFLLDDERHVDPTELTAALETHIRSSGATVLEGTEAVAFPIEDGRVTAVRTRSGTVETDALVLAAGTWTGRLAANLGLQLPLQAAKGYSFTIRPKVPPRRPIYLSEAKVGLTPFGAGLRVAGGLELSGLNERLDGRRIDAMKRVARTYLEDWPSETIEHEWVGLRPLAPDGLPIMGPVEGLANAFVTTGHGTLGVTLAPASGEAVADMVLSNEVPAIIRPFTPARF